MPQAGPGSGRENRYPLTERIAQRLQLPQLHRRLDPSATVRRRKESPISITARRRRVCRGPDPGEIEEIAQKLRQAAGRQQSRPAWGAVQESEKR